MAARRQDDMRYSHFTVIPPDVTTLQWQLTTWR